ncbi:hypothetical protein [Candidatus Nanohalococcus occultus]|uniref:Uncharacterized protein n=1 Tax=Candidatus Nanohalococcus occultus TaxID=2978047 RepID=A0ABY8CGE3_9ARCH|nr:hypothetical protein SVXNc_0078 [Candidatus Nanohaloarchaeota archaeon SVXNc]
MNTGGDDTPHEHRVCELAYRKDRPSYGRPGMEIPSKNREAKAYSESDFQSGYENASALQEAVGKLDGSELEP